MFLSHFHPTRRLRSRISLLVLLAVGALALLMATQSHSRLAQAYDDAGRTALQGIAATFDDGFSAADLRDPAELQRRMTQLKDELPELHKVSVSWAAPDGGTMLAQAGHEHDPDGTKRDVTTARVIRTRGSTPAPFDAPDYHYREQYAAQAHFARLERPIGRTASGAPLAVLELHYDLKALDMASARQQRTVATIAILGAITVALLLALLLTRAVVMPVDLIRQAANGIRRGDRGLRLNWHRSDELGDLARDFDLMADALLEAEKDPLTGVLNHRAFQERLGQELNRGRRTHTQMAIVAIDVDNFKAVNDVDGHAAGDAALLGLARAIATSIRPFDVCGRVGGDEFVLGLSGTTPQEAVEVVERIRQALIASGDAAGCALTISAGVAAFPEHAIDQERLLHLADGAMYWAKSGGKNRTVVFTPEVDSALSPADAAERNLRDGLVRTVHALARAVDAKDGYTSAHSHRVAEYAVALARAAGLDQVHIEEIRTAGVLHDVGKIGIADAILLKTGGLDNAEFDEMKRHSELGRDIVAGAGLERIAEWVLHLHERFDGHGYPGRLAGQEIPLESRILHCADALEAMTSSRVYRSALPTEVALAELEDGAGTQFDPGLVGVLVDLVRSGRLVVRGSAVPASV
jgi:diguanylate cyclase (GGDEF)-like protein